MTSSVTKLSTAAASRTNRIVSAVSIGYLTQVLTLTTGLWLTPFLLQRLGVDQYGLWLLALQATTYLGLLDLGVVAVLPREVAYAVGRAKGDKESEELPALLGRTLRIVLYQLPAVAVIALGTLLLLPVKWLPVRGPLLVILACFLLMFPVRTFHATLQGLQETPYLSRVTLWSWGLGTLTTIGLVLTGAGLYAAAAGWAITQVTSGIAWTHRLWRHYPTVLPSKLPPVSRALVRQWMTSGLWVSVAQVAQMLLSGTDILIIGQILGPAAVVPYAITGKLIQVLANQPQMVMHAAQPAISELRATEGAVERLVHVTTSLGQLMLLISGGGVVTILTINQGFVYWWTGAQQFAGHSVTLGVLLAMLLRHFNTTNIYTMFSMGYERRIAVITLVEGIVTMAVSTLAIRQFGLVGASIGSIVGVSLIGLPVTLLTLARDTERSVSTLLRPYAAWTARLVLFVLAAVLLMNHWVPATLLSLGSTAAIAILAYALVMMPIALRDPLGIFVRPRFERARQLFPWTRRLNALF